MSASAPRMARDDTRRDDRHRGRLLPYAVLALGLLELVILAVIGHVTSVWWVLGIVLVGWVVGIALLVAAGQQSFVRLRSLIRAIRGRGDIAEHMSRPAFTLLAAICFFFPGVLTDVIGLVLLVVPVQKRVARDVGLTVPEGARRVLYKRSGAGVIEGEIVVDAQRTDRGGSSAAGGVPPVITQD